MRSVFADTFYFIALLDSRDRAHARAIYFSRMPGLRLVTTDYVLLELGDAFRKPPYRAEFLLLWELLHHEPVFQIIPGNKPLLPRGLQYYKRRADKDWQLTDCISFAVMQDLGLKEALTGDRHFTQAGFKAFLA